MSRRPQLRLCLEGLYYSCVVAAILCGAVGRQLNLLMLLGTVLAGPLVFALIHGWWMLRRVEVSRRLGERLAAGQGLTVDIHLANAHRRLALWTVEVEDTLERLEEARVAERSTVAVLFPRVAAGHEVHASYRGRIERRGRYRFGPLRVSTRFPFGLVKHWRVIDSTEEVLVHPRLGKLQFEWLREARKVVGASGHNARRGTIEADFYGLRDWRSGDSRRLIHWRTSARRGQLVVRQFDEHRWHDVALVVDLWQGDTASDEQTATVERAVSLAATLMEGACRQRGTRLVVDIVGREHVRRVASASGTLFGELMDELAVVAPHGEPDGVATLAESLSQLGPATTILVVSTRAVDAAALASGARLDGRGADRRLHVFNAADAATKQHFHV